MIEIETDRLCLRPVAAADLDLLHQLWNDPRVREFLWDDLPVSHQQTAAEIERSDASFAARRFGQWLVLTRTRRSPIGFCGLRRCAESEEVEVLYGIDPLQWGLGLATEAASAVLRYGFESVGLDRILAGAEASNEASCRVMSKLGMHSIGRTDRSSEAILRYSVSRAAFRPREGWYRVIESTVMTGRS
jgi:ribosomal-protein-alanine N-acetyltransferase